VNAPRRLVSTIFRPRPALAAWLVLVFIASSIPLPEGAEVDFPVRPDRILHGLAYAVLAVLAVRALRRPRDRRARAAAAVLGAVAYGALIEGWQPLIGRTAEWGDLVADAVGAVLGGLVGVAACLGHRPRNRNGQERSDHDLGGRSQAD